MQVQTPLQGSCGVQLLLIQPRQLLARLPALYACPAPIAESWSLVTDLEPHLGLCFWGTARSPRLRTQPQGATLMRAAFLP